jgi:hypothetical protein
MRLFLDHLAGNRAAGVTGREIKRTPGRPLHRTGNDRLALPLRLFRKGERAADAELSLSPAEAEHPHAALCRALDDHPAPVNSPDCCRRVQMSPSHGPVVGHAYPRQAPGRPVDTRAGSLVEDGPRAPDRSRSGAL